MAIGLLEAAEVLRAALAGFDTSVVSGEEAAAVAEQLAVTEKACAVGRARASVRAAECRAHERRGFDDPAEWVARVAGTSRREARLALGIGAEVGRDSAVGAELGAALAAGELSLAQASEIGRTEADLPGTAEEMLALARESSLAALRHEGRRRRLAAADPEELHRRHQRLRRLHHWVDAEGMVRLSAALAPEAGVPLVNRLDRQTERVRREASRGEGERAEGEREPRAAHAADALVALLSGKGGGGRSSTDLVIVCDLRAYRRGHTHPGEPCHIVGGGPVPVRVAHEAAEDAFVKAVTHDGVRIESVLHYGRHIPAHLRTALELGPPPQFDGVACVERGCGRRYGLEWDHVDPVAHNGPTAFDNLEARCWPHHRAKTERDRAAGLLGVPP